MRQEPVPPPVATFKRTKKPGGGLKKLVQEELNKDVLPRIKELEAALEAISAQLKKAEFVISLLVASKK